MAQSARDRAIMRKLNPRTLGDHLRASGLEMHIELTKLYSQLTRTEDKLQFWRDFAPYIQPKLKAHAHSVEVVDPQPLRWLDPDEPAEEAKVIDLADWQTSGE